MRSKCVLIYNSIYVHAEKVRSSSYSYTALVRTRNRDRTPSVNWIFSRYSYRLNRNSMFVYLLTIDFVFLFFVRFMNTMSGIVLFVRCSGAKELKKCDVSDQDLCSWSDSFVYIFNDESLVFIAVAVWCTGVSVFVTEPSLYFGTLSVPLHSIHNSNTETGSTNCELLSMNRWIFVE